MARVKVEVTKSLEKVYKVRNGMTIGRDPKNHIQLLASPVSRSHAQFVVEGDKVTIIDLGSSNGTKVNNKRIMQCVLNDGDVIEIGGIHITFEKEVARVADQNVFTVESPEIPEDVLNQMAGKSELGLVFPTDTVVIDAAYNVGRRFLEKVNLSDDDNMNLLTALYEAIDNAKRHGNKGDKTKKIRLYFIDSQDKVTVTVIDEGKGFDFGTVLQKSQEQDALSAARERYLAGGMGGLGIRLMLKCVDKIEYEMEGSKIVLSKFKKPLPAGEVETKELTKEEEVYKHTLWEEMKKVEPSDKPKDDAEKQALTPEKPAEQSRLPQADDRPIERVQRFQDRLSAFFMKDGREGLRIVSPQEVAKEPGKESEKSPEKKPEEKKIPDKKTTTSKKTTKESEDDILIDLPDNIRLETEIPEGEEDEDLLDDLQ